MTTRALLPSLLLSLLVLAVPACGSTEETGETDPDPTGGGDGKYHPAANGVHMSETAACDALADGYDKRRQSMSPACTGTTRPCPDFLRVTFKTQCMEYDQGSVQGCVDYYTATTSCSALADALTKCVVTPYPGTEPAGCP